MKQIKSCWQEVSYSICALQRTTGRVGSMQESDFVSIFESVASEVMGSRTLEQIHFDNRKFDYYRTDIIFGKFGDSLMQNLLMLCLLVLVHRFSLLLSEASKS
jgi:hypothetical protein